MRITYYGYNTFLVQDTEKNIVVDPGGDLYLFKMKPLLPKKHWGNITHIFITHADPDHHWHSDRVQNASHAKVVCNKTMLKRIQGKDYMIGPREKGLSFKTILSNVFPVGINETIFIDDMKITGIRSTHGPLKFKVGPFKKVLKPGEKERIGFGAIGFKIELNSRTIVNLGDTLLLEGEWKNLENVDVLMLPVGGGNYGNTMDEKEALIAIKIIRPRYVIPCHYNCSSFFSRNKKQLNISKFKKEVENAQMECVDLLAGESFEI